MRKLVTFAFVAHLLVEGAILIAGVAFLSREEAPEAPEPIEGYPSVPPIIDPELDSLSQRLDGRKMIARAILLVADETGVDPDLILGIIRVENPWLIADTVNSYGAEGLMQVVGRLHMGDYPECGDDLLAIYTNICYGTRIYLRKLDLAGGDQSLALLYFNGCWGITYTKGCEDYPQRVEAAL